LAITKHTKEFLEGLIDYYVEEAAAYRQIAQGYLPEVGSVKDVAFLRAYENENKSVELDDLQEFNRILKEKAPAITAALNKTESPE
jgi:hypothetical protein